MDFFVIVLHFALGIIYNASMDIMDFVIIGATVLFAIIGLVKGGAKMFFGLFMLLIIMVGSAFISSAICPLFLRSEKEDGSVTYTGAATVLMEPFGTSVLPTDGDIGAFLDAEVTRGPDGTLYVEGVKLTDAISEKVPYVGSFLASIVEKAARPGETLRTTLSYKMTEYVYETAVWVVLVIILAIIRNIIRKKIFVYLDSHPAPSKIDRVIGLVLNLAILLVLLWGVGALVARFDDGANWANAADNFMIKGLIAEPLMTNNPFLKLMGVTLPIA